jgi:hypothetical protein
MVFTPSQALASTTCPTKYTAARAIAPYGNTGGSVKIPLSRCVTKLAREVKSASGEACHGREQGKINGQLRANGEAVQRVAG